MTRLWAAAASRRAARPAAAHILVFATYFAVSVAYFGRLVVTSPSHTLAGSGMDATIYVWSFAWWPYAISHWTNPLVTHLLFAPQGINLAWTATTPALALAFAPVTEIVGPVASYNLAALLLPALAAWTAYLLCRHLTHSFWAAVVGGYLFGFSSYVLGQQLEGHLHLTGIFLLPLVALVLLRYVEGGLDGRGLAWRFGALMGLQLWISTEFALTVTFVVALGLVLAATTMPRTRPRLRSSLTPIAGGYALAVVLAAPLLVYALLGFQRQDFSASGQAVTDSANLLVPTTTNAIAGGWFPSVNADFSLQDGLYLGLPALVIVAAYAFRARRDRAARLLVALFAVTVILTLGTELEFDGRKLIALPWRYAVRLPLLDNVSAGRFAAFAALATAAIVSMWTATTKHRLAAVILPVLAVAAIVPALSGNLYGSRPATPRFFADGLYRNCVAPGSTLLVFPFGHDGYSMLWQAETGFHFSIAEGYMYPQISSARPVSAFDDDPIVRLLEFNGWEGFPGTTMFLALAATHDVSRIVVVPSSDPPRRGELQAAGRIGATGGVLVAPRCGDPSLLTRNLKAQVDAAQGAENHTIGYCAGGTYVSLPAGLIPEGDFAGAHRAVFVQGQGLGCAVPSGYVARGYATAGVPPHTYRLYAPP